MLGGARNLGVCPACASPRLSSISSSVTLPRTRRGCIETYERAEREDCDLVAFPELAITGYPPEDLLLRPAFVAQATETLEKLAVRTGRTAAVIGFPEADRDLYNSAAVCAHGKVQGVYRKHLLPNYAVFDEERYFEPWPNDGPLFVVGGVRVAVSICEDAWSPAGPILTQAASGAELVVNINASPYHAGRLGEREAMLADPGGRRRCSSRVREPGGGSGRVGVRRRVDVLRRVRSADRPGQAVRRRLPRGGPRSASGISAASPRSSGPTAR